ncbi:bifunctional metallophosphatase/5'-nucleotidase [Tuberibacillus sp. Marseille-P3662]|uniref:bifunctional metallophosphatase/5'-nucleotidase n=1 Tax=Tuberibacillus sp. Marseille-P3662 TaxID=1965358 RepID=UPI000A1CAEF3|nr:bifunctional UDP-sugar hydrolase/5'-nucleotidase [Tuberibacillus sp. Marseille-P3662]
MIPLHIYHTNDLHSHFDYWPNIVHFLKQKRLNDQEKGEHSLTLELGDHMDRFHSLTEGTMGVGNVELMNQAGYDYATIGNNEGVTFTKGGLETAYDVKQFDILLSNLFTVDGGRPEWSRPYVIHQLENNISIGITAVTAPFYPFYSRLGWDVRDPWETLPSILDKLKEQTDIVIVMSHVGLFFDEALAQARDDIDVIVGAHTHHLLKDGHNVNQTLIVQNGKHGQYAGEINLLIDPEAKRIVQKKAMTYNMKQWPEDPETVQLLTSLQEKADKRLEQPAMSLSETLETNWFRPSPLPELLATALREWCHADLSMINAGVILDHLEAGPVNQADIHRICPHPINPVRVEVKGLDLVEAIETGLKTEFQHLELKGLGFRGKMLGCLIFDQLTYQMEGERPVNIYVKDQPIDPDATYILATADMFAFSQKLMPPVNRAQSIDFYLPEMLRDLLMWQLKK